MDYKPFIALAVLLPATALAQDTHYPARRAGLWEGTANVGNTTVLSKSCVDTATDRKMIDFGYQQLKQHGGQVSVNVEGNIVHVSSVAQVANHTMTIEQTLTFHSDSKVTGTGHTTIDPPFPQLAASMPTDSTSELHWAGPCPADLKPGDIVTNGQKHNVSDLVSN